MRLQVDRVFLDQPFPDALRLRVARGFYALALVLLPACLIATPWGLTPAACCTLVAALLAPDRIWRARKAAGWPVLAMLLVVLFVVAVVSFSVLVHHDTWQEAGSRGRVLMIPMAALMVLGLAPPRAALWGGAVLGLFGACIVALVQTMQHLPRADGWNNAITFADMAVLLLALVVFLRPSGRFLITVAATCAGLVAIGLSGTRGAWPAAALVVIIALFVRITSGRGHRVEAAMLVLLAVAAFAVVLPQVQQRVEALQVDMLRYAAGDPDSSSGARLELFALATGEMQARPWTGAGVGRFERVVHAAPQCQVPDPDRWCSLGHAHSDFPEWGATMGIPGLLALLALYGVPAWLFARQVLVRPFPRRSRSAALAGLAVVTTFVLCGLSQSMWAHQLSGGSFLVLVGVLLGFSLREDPAKL
ncbi:O-antigen ligase family protein [Pseudoxanthomonas sp.]|uniref:O-antigen ligase family protein n=1 Tax=Pseudoxanthomonas sp. TaxID=1871049 RepID=UPI002618B96A|nr:O-antigen ligase family protein [Pseudoxanthomonas sp.]WDS37840.1 MAG: O-antigen ligase family protein [Pseudoxanthomonas sp.]